MCLTVAQRQDRAVHADCRCLSEPFWVATVSMRGRNCVAQPVLCSVVARAATKQYTGNFKVAFGSYTTHTSRRGSSWRFKLCKQIVHDAALRIPKLRQMQPFWPAHWDGAHFNPRFGRCIVFPACDVVLSASPRLATCRHGRSTSHASAAGLTRSASGLSGPV